MKMRKLRCLEVTEVGMGCMAFSHGCGQVPTRTTQSRFDSNFTRR